MRVRQMRTLLNDRDQKEVLDRLSKVRPDSQRRWGSMSAHQMICHLSDSFRVAWRKARQFFLDVLQADDLQVGGSLGASQVAARHQDTT
jgi:hypothetical protein